ncbi:MAG: ABC transporter permease [Aeoliella sp.]
MAAVPWVVWIVAAGLRNLPAAPEEEASLSAAPWQVLRSITLPVAAPVVGIAALWVMVSVAAEMTVTDFFQIRTFAEEVYTQAAAGGFQTDNPIEDYRPWQPLVRASGLIGGIGLLATLTVVALVIGHPWLMQANDSRPQSPWLWRLGKGKLLGAAIPIGVLLLVAGFPVACLVHEAGISAIRAGDDWQRFWSFEKLLSELGRSLDLHSRELGQTLLLGLTVATASTGLGLLAAWHIRQRCRAPLGFLVLFALALAVPGPLLAIAVIHLLNHPIDSFLHPLSIAYDRTLIAPWLVQTVRFTPVAAIVIAAGFASVPGNLLDAAKSDGAGWASRLLLIALPMTWPMVVAAWLVTLALSAGELAATVLVMPPGPDTLAIQLFKMLHQGADDQVAAMSLVLLSGVLILAAVAVWLGMQSRKRPPL